MVTSSLFVSSVIDDIYTLTIVYGALVGVGMGMIGAVLLSVLGAVLRATLGFMETAIA